MADKYGEDIVVMSILKFDEKKSAAGSVIAVIPLLFC